MRKVGALDPIASASTCRLGDKLDDSPTLTLPYPLVLVGFVLRRSSNLVRVSSAARQYGTTQVALFSLKARSVKRNSI